MARYKPIDTRPKFLPVDLTRQLLPGSFEHALTLTDEEVGMAANAMEYLTAVIGVASGLVDDDPVH